MLDADPTKPDLGGWLGHRVDAANLTPTPTPTPTPIPTPTPTPTPNPTPTPHSHPHPNPDPKQVNDGAILVPGSSTDTEVRRHVEETLTPNP